MRYRDRPCDDDNRRSIMCTAAIVTTVTRPGSHVMRLVTCHSACHVGNGTPGMTGGQGAGCVARAPRLAADWRPRQACRAR